MMSSAQHLSRYTALQQTLIIACTVKKQYPGLREESLHVNSTFDINIENWNSALFFNPPDCWETEPNNQQQVKLPCVWASEEWKADILCWVVLHPVCQGRARAGLAGKGSWGDDPGRPQMSHKRGMTGSCHWLLRGTHSSPWLWVFQPQTEGGRHPVTSIMSHYCHWADYLQQCSMFYHLFSLCFTSLTFLNSLSLSVITIVHSFSVHSVQLYNDIATE